MNQTLLFFLVSYLFLGGTFNNTVGMKTKCRTRLNMLETLGIEAEEEKA